MGINFSAIPSRLWAGKLLRWPLKAIPGELTLPILQGRLRGKWWIVGSSTHGCWLGSYEYDKRKLFESRVAQGDVVYDVGAHAGFYSLLASVLVGSTGQVVAFEPYPRNLAYLHRHLVLNHVNNVKVVESAVNDREGMVCLTARPGSSEVCVDSSGSLLAPAVMLDALVHKGHFPPPAVMKMDIEGSEAAALRGALWLLAEKRPLLFLSTHGSEVHAQCCHLLLGLGVI